MSYANSLLAKYWSTPWLRSKGIDMLREEHIARWAFTPGDIIVRPFCGLCGQANHYGVVMERTPGQDFARVRMACKNGKAFRVGVRFLKRPLPPYPKEVLDLRHHVRKELKSLKKRISE